MARASRKKIQSIVETPLPDAAGVHEGQSDVGAGRKDFPGVEKLMALASELAGVPEKKRRKTTKVAKTSPEPEAKSPAPKSKAAAKSKAKPKSKAKVETKAKPKSKAKVETEAKAKGKAAKSASDSHVMSFAMTEPVIGDMPKPSRQASRMASVDKLLATAATKKKPAKAAALAARGAAKAEAPVIAQPIAHKITAAEAAKVAGGLIEELMTLKRDSVSSVTRSDEGWLVTVNVVELARIPHSTDVIAAYSVTLDPEGNLQSYKRGMRYMRQQLGEEL